MNFSFEGNYKSKRNINLGGNKAPTDKKTLLAKAQSERKARELERLRWNSALKIQSFYRGRQIASVIHQQERLLLEQQLKQLIPLMEQTYDSVTTASISISSILVSCIRQLLLLCHSPAMTLVHSTYIGDLSNIMSSNISIHGVGNQPESFSVIQLLLFNEQQDMDTTLWLLVLLVRRLFSRELGNDAWTGHSVPILLCLRHLVDPSTYSILQYNCRSSTLEPRGIYLRFMTHILMRDNLFNSLHILMCQQLATEHEIGTSRSDDAFGLIIEISVLCLDNLYPPFEYPASRIGDLRPPSIRQHTRFGDFSSTNTTTTQNNPAFPPILTRKHILNLLISEIISVPTLLDTNRGFNANAFVKKLPFDELLQNILQNYQNGDNEEQWIVEPDVVAGLLINLMVIGNQQAIIHLEPSLIAYCRVYQTLLCKLPPHYLPDTNKTQSQTQMILDSESEESDSDDGKIATRHHNLETSASDTTNYNTYVKLQLAALFSSDSLDILLHQFLNFTFELYNEQGAISPSSLTVIRSVASLFVSFIIRWPTKKDHALNTLLYYHLRIAKQNEVSFLQILWQGWLHGGNGLSVFDESKGQIMDHLQEAIQTITDSTVPENWSVLYLLCEMYTRLLLTIGDDEFFDKSAGYNQLKLNEVIGLSTYLKNISFSLFWRANILDVNVVLGSTGIQVGQLRNTTTTLLQQIHMRDSRRPFCPKGHWLIYGLDTESFSSAVVAEEYALENGDTLVSSSSSSPSPFEQRRLQHVKQTMSKARLAMVSPRLGLLNNIPFVISFEHRVQIFRMFVTNDRKRNNILDFVRPHAEVRIRRDHVFEDGFNQLYKLGPDLKKKISIMFIDSFGIEESGIDGGGVFKEFLTSLGHESFNTDYGLFSSTPDQLLYPNPGSFATEASQLAYFEFLGLVIGKALYEGILLDVAFAEFFLKKCLGKINYLDDLPSLDPELYKGLIQVKNFDGNVEDLCLDFTLTENGNQSRTINLIPNGSNTLAFFSGLSTIVDTKWLRMFNQQELQVMLGGASIPIDINDLRQHTVYADYRESDPTIQFMWQALSSFTNEERMKFVKFVTSCSRPPILGFKELQPQLCIRRAGTDESRLPTSSTCVNLLKLPAFSTYHGLREKLLYAINADAGFDLS
ncbi:hypothetical protein BCR42DRAFT_406881 [Absidia repens]|uniref:HECT-type E3 ubiquitin transferase n=1 Tax=Absidia repens TaxID=90262 RepID=A0A1X2IRI7_9FUNG|nr:hypothetical protein BCR42DRAFT_406881 [Absidia repens]